MQPNLKEKEILFVKNITREGPGLLEDIVKERGIKYTIVYVSQYQNILTLENCGAVVLLGGPNSANDRDQKMKTELVLIRKILNAKIPFLGICLGLQTLVKAAGGKVVKSKNKEIGFRDQNGKYFTVELTEFGQSDSLFIKLENSFKVFQLHGETVVLTENMKLLAIGEHCRNQIVKIGTNSYGIQCHFELTSQMLQTWINEDQDLKKLDRDQLQSDFETIKDNYIQTGRQLFLNFLNIAGFQ